MARLNWRKLGPAAGPRRPSRVYDPDEILGILPPDPKVPFDPREVLARTVDGSEFDEYKPRYGTVAGHRLGPAARLSGRGARQPPRRAVQRGGQEGHRVHPAGQPDRHPAGLPAEHHRLHGRHRVRAGRHHQGRRKDDQRRHQQRGAAPDDQHGELVRRGQLRHVRAGLRPAVDVRVAGRQARGHGRGAARGGAVDRRPGVRRGAGPAVRRGRRPRPRGRHRGPDRGRVATRSPSPPGSTTTASSTPATPAPCSASRCRPSTRRPSPGGAASASSGCEAHDPQAAGRQPRARSPPASSAPPTSWASPPSPSSPTPTPTRPYVALADEAVRLPGAAPADTYLRGDLLDRGRPRHRRRRRPPRLRLPLGERRVRPRLRGGRADLRRAAARGDRGHGLEDRGQGADGGGRGARRCPA